MLLNISSKLIDAVDLGDHFSDPTTPYRLLALLSSQLPAGSLVADLGTREGDSATALAVNTTVRVVTYDIVVNGESVRLANLENVQFIQKDCISDVDNYAGAILISLDLDPHDGIQEQKVLELLLEKKFRGLLVCDDINPQWWPEMKEWWDTIMLKKYDVTFYGHFSGTGIVVFDEQFIDVNITS